MSLPGANAEAWNSDGSWLLVSSDHDDTGKESPKPEQKPSTENRERESSPEDLSSSWSDVEPNRTEPQRPPAQTNSASKQSAAKEVARWGTESAPEVPTQDAAEATHHSASAPSSPRGRGKFLGDSKQPPSPWLESSAP